MSSVVLPGRVRVLGLCAALAGVIAPPPPAASEPTVRHVLIEEFAFVPERLEIRPGDKVEWVNRDIAPHTATASDRAWDTGGLRKSRSAAVGFPALGTFAYFCSYHPHMRGEIIVVGE